MRWRFPIALSPTETAVRDVGYSRDETRTNDWSIRIIEPETELRATPP